MRVAQSRNKEWGRDAKLPIKNDGRRGLPSKKRARPAKRIKNRKKTYWITRIVENWEKMFFCRLFGNILIFLRDEFIQKYLIDDRQRKKGTSSVYEKCCQEDGYGQRLFKANACKNRSLYHRRNIGETVQASGTITENRRVEKFLTLITKVFMYSTRSGLVLGFHGCDHSVAQAVLNGQSFLKASFNSYDWLGHGFFFWENSPSRALEFAEQVQKYPNRSRGIITNTRKKSAVPKNKAIGNSRKFD